MIPLLIESSYGANLWAQAYLAGIREEAHKRNRNVTEINGQSIPDKPVLILGSTSSWLRKEYARITSFNLPVIIAGVPPCGIRCSFVAPDYEDVISRFLSMTSRLEPNQRALFGAHPSSAADEVKRESFERQCPQGIVFENQGNLLEVGQVLKRSANEFGAILCTNDIAAMTLRRLFLGEPKSPLLYSFGEQALPRESDISLFHMDLFTSGAHAVRLYRLIENDPNTRYCCWTFCRLESNQPETVAEKFMSDNVPHVSEDFYKDPRVGEVFRFKELLSGIDSLDMDILRELLKKKKYFEIAESLNTTDNTIKYRIRRMITAIGLRDRAELLMLACEYLAPGDVIHNTHNRELRKPE